MKAAFRCDQGLVRAMNQDSVLFVDSPIGPVSALFAVADGMGGHKAGEVASALMVKQVTDIVRRRSEMPAMVRDYWSDVLTEAGNAVYRCSLTKPEYNNMGTTFVMSAFFDDRMSVCNIGDSRCYGLKKSCDLIRLTRDHSLVQELFDQGQLTREQVRTFPRRNVITRAIGPSENVPADIFFFDPDDFKKVLLCSDGLHGLVEDWELETVLRDDASPENTAERLLRLALSRGGVDNISIVVIDLSGGGAC